MKQGSGSKLRGELYIYIFFGKGKGNKEESKVVSENHIPSFLCVPICCGCRWEGERGMWEWKTKKQKWKG